MAWQDAALLLGQVGVYAVAEGAGRSAPADAAATASIRALERRLSGRGSEHELSVREAARQAMWAANEEVWRLATTQSAYPTMAAAAGLLVLDGSRAAFLGVGGVRLLRLREGRVGFLHGPVGSRRRRLGERPGLDLRAVGLDVKPGDVYVLASDGLERALLRAGLIATILGRREPGLVVDGLVSLARAEGHGGRLVVVAVDVLAD